jgi:hypothetical protein
VVEDGALGLDFSDGICSHVRFFDTVHLLVFQEIIKTMQIGSFDVNLRRRRQLRAEARHGDHGLGRERLLLGQ